MSVECVQSVQCVPSEEGNGGPRRAFLQGSSSDFGVGVEGLWCRVQGLGCRVQGLGCRVQGVGCRGWCLRLGVLGLRCRVTD